MSTCMLGATAIVVVFKFVIGRHDRPEHPSDVICEPVLPEYSHSRSGVPPYLKITHRRTVSVLDVAD